MKLSKRILTAGMALGLAVGLNVPAFAATITISNPAANETYTAYKLFDVTNAGTAYAYSTTNETLKTELSNANLGITFTKAASGNVWYVDGIDDESDAAALAAYINTHWTDTFRSLLGSTAIEANLVDVAAPGEEEKLEMQIDTGDATGYYFVDSSLGSLCALNTATDEVEVNEKNSVPTIDKKVKEDSTDTYGDTATVDTIDTIYYQLTVNNGTGYQNLGTGVDDDYTIKDELPDGITYTANSVAIEGWTVTTDYSVEYKTTDGDNDLIITLNQSKLSTLNANTNIVITYNASAAAALTPNKAYENNVTLKYKEQTATDKATIKTYSIGNDANDDPTITKVDGKDNTTPLSGVKFVLSKTVTVPAADGQGDPTTKKTVYATFDGSYNLTDWVDTQDDADPLVTDTNGNIYAYGLDADIYTLTETETKPGYNLLDGTITVEIKDNGTVTYDLTSDTTPAGPSITIVNNAGTQLPSTGGMGTTVLYIAGIVLVLGAGIVLVVRRRMDR